MFRFVRFERIDLAHITDVMPNLLCGNARVVFGRYWCSHTACPVEPRAGCDVKLMRFFEESFEVPLSTVRPLPFRVDAWHWRD